MIASSRVANATAWAGTIQHAIELARDSGADVLACAITSIDEIDMVARFAAAWRDHVDCGYWEQPDRDFAILGIGSATSIEAEGVTRFSTIDQRWRHLHDSIFIDRDEDCPRSLGPMLLGGFAFANTPSTGGEWRGFTPARFFVPRTTFVRQDGRFFQIRCVRVDARDLVEKVASKFDHEDGEIGQTPSDVHQMGSEMSEPIDIRGHAAWERLVTQGTDAISTETFEKVVLARAVHIRSKAFNVRKALQNLVEHYPTCTTFAIGVDRGCFMGATPERLVQLSNDIVSISCIAGTAARGATEIDDARLGTQLLESDKNRREHAYVVETITNALAEHSDTVNVPTSPTLLRVRNLQHLYTPVTAKMKPGHSLFDLVADLHPTPAVGGTPRQPALAFIADHEMMDRGWYAAPIGWVDVGGNGEFVVGLRSGVVQQRDEWADAYLFAGCGIVAGSQPDAELRESQLKLRPMLSALGAEAT